MEQKIERRGGKRKNAGPKFIYGEDTCNITLRVPKSKKEEIKKMTNNIVLTMIKFISLFVFFPLFVA